MSLIFQILIFLYISIIFAVALYTLLIAKREVNPLRHLFNWYISPLIVIAGLIFIVPGRKRKFFRKVKSDLLIR